MDPKIAELRRLVMFEAIWGDETWRKAVTEALPVIEAQGARVAVLEKELAWWKEHADAERKRGDGLEAENAEARERLEKRTAELKEERDGFREQMQLAEQRANLLDDDVRNLRERLSAAEEGNRELVRRAQQAEANWEHATKDRDYWLRRSTDLGSRAEAAEARCTTLSAAGRVLSAVADRTGESEENAPPQCGHRPLPTWICRLKVGHTLPHEVVPFFPCSPTCTHDDAAKPGHPDRVKERSEAVTHALNPDAESGIDEPLPEGPLEVVTTRRPSTEYEQMAYQLGLDEGVEAMRAACWEAVQTYLRAHGTTEKDGVWTDMKAAIEGAVP
jgi:hypothetical protein